jgi:hypothetical protein
MGHYFKWLKLSLDAISKPEYIIDNQISAGVVIIAGDSGVGKTSAVVGMALCAAGLTTDKYQFKNTEPRQVVYSAEDPEQVRRIIKAMIADGTVVEDEAVLDDRFHLMEAQRLSSMGIADEGEDFVRGLGAGFASPLLVLDTTNANIDLDNENDSQQVGRAIGDIRTGFRGANIWLIGHTAKAEGSRSFRGSGAWKADTRQEVIIYRDDDLDQPAISFAGKHRVYVESAVFALNARCMEISVIGKNGPETYTEIYGDPHAMTPEAIEAAKADRKEATKQANSKNRRAAIVKFVRDKGRPSKTDIHKADTVKGAIDAITADIDWLVNDGVLGTVKEGRSHRFFLKEETRERDYQ